MGIILKGDILEFVNFGISKNGLRSFKLVVALNSFLLPLKVSCRNKVLKPAEKSITCEKPVL